MFTRDPERLERLRAAVRYLLTNSKLEHGHQAQLAQHFSVTRQRVNQIVSEEELRTGVARPKRQVAHGLEPLGGRAAQSSREPSAAASISGIT